MIKEEEILLNNSSSYEFERVEFNRIRKLYFDSFTDSSNKSSLEKIIEMKQFLQHCEIPHNSEPFVDEKDTPLLWVWDNPYIQIFENEFKEKLSLFRSKHIDLKKHFSKIFLEEDKNKSNINFKLFLALTKSFLGINHLLIPLFKSLVYMYYKNSIDYDLALKELNNAENMLVYLDPSKSTKNIFSYFVNLYKANLFIKVRKYEEAERSLTAAIKFNPKGTNAYITKCYLYTALNNYDMIRDAVNKILSIDLEKIQNAIKNNNLERFYYFLQNPSLPNIFNNNSLAPSYQIISKVLSDNFDKTITFDNIEVRINAINEIELIEFIDENQIEQVLFINHIFSDKNITNTVYFKLIIPLIEEIFLNIIDALKKNVNKKFLADLYSKIEDFNRRIKELENKKREFENELVKSKELAEKKMQESIKLFDESITNAISESELMLSNVDSVSKLNPVEALQSSMIYNFVTSIFVFIIAILANYINLDHSDVKTFSIINYLIIAGIKWAAITFLIGVVIASIYSVLVFAEKTNYQLNLKKKISQLKREKDVNIELIKKEFEKKIKNLTEETNIKIELTEKRIEELKKEKMENESSLKAKAEHMMEPIMNKINLALNPNLQNNDNPA